jgi:hypothetical protein
VWRGAPGERLGHAAIASMQRFVQNTEDRVRVIGGARFNAKSATAPEWEAFGSYLMLLPAIELVRTCTTVIKGCHASVLTTNAAVIIACYRMAHQLRVLTG